MSNKVTHPKPLTRHELRLISNQNLRRINVITKGTQSYELLFSKDYDRWEHDMTRTAQFKHYHAYTKAHSYLDEIVPF